MAAGDSITSAGLNAIISKIETECDTPRRDIAALGWTVTAGNLINATEFNDIRTKLIAINADHCYCEGDGNIEIHNGGTSKTITSTAVSAGSLIYYTDLSKRNADIDTLDAQCAQVSCTCDGDCTVCTCNTNVCTCNSHCSSVCSCNAYCICNFVCSCEFDGKVPVYACTCEGNCTCHTNCSSVCTCNKLCTCVDNCAIECNCNDVCTCEFH